MQQENSANQRYSFPLAVATALDYVVQMRGEIYRPRSMITMVLKTSWGIWNLSRIGSETQHVFHAVDALRARSRRRGRIYGTHYSTCQTRLVPIIRMTGSWWLNRLENVLKLSYILLGRNKNAYNQPYPKHIIYILKNITKTNYVLPERNESHTSRCTL